MRPWSRALFSLPFICSVSCGPVPDPRTGTEADLRPPLVELVRTLGPREISVEFDEEATLVAGKVRISPSLPVREITGPGRRISIRAGEQIPGCRYTLEAEAEDARGNISSFMADFYGFNPRIPRVVVNEFTPRGSGNHPDLVELAVVSDGDMGGVVLYQGTPCSYDDRLVFPSLAVKEGDFILVHFKPSGDPDEMNETADKASSKGFDASDCAFDFWIMDGVGIAGNNGAISLYDRPGGGLMDAVLYSNRTSESDESYRGFGSADLLLRAEELERQEGWKIAGNRVAPEDAVNPEGSTGTRSICRSAGSTDTDSREDWHIVPTRGSTFGSENSDEIYVPPARSARAQSEPAATGDP